MPAINPQTIIDLSLQRFLRLPVPPGTDRNRYTNYLQQMSRAINQALQTWRTSAYLEGIRIDGPVANGGKLRSVALDPLILQQAPAGWEAYSRAIAAGIHNQFTSFANEVSVPGLRWYPTFAAFPGPSAPPTPNVPCPLSALSASAARHVKEAAIVGVIYDKMPNPKPPPGKELATAAASAVEQAFMLWLPVQIVQNVLGRGPVPTFAPPYVPVGPVVGGDNIAAPGHIAG